MSDRNLQILASPGFVVSLLLLLLNDFVFKAQFHNHVTGKLSDFAGLFAFSLFWAAFFPRQRSFVCISTAVLFVFWKSVYSQFLIEGWNSLPFFGIGRTVDYSDLWALLVLPFSYFYAGISPDVQVPRRLIYLTAIVSVFAFTATSYSQKFSYNQRYEFQISKQELLERISRLPENAVNDSFADAETISIDFDDCTDRATAIVQDMGNQSVIVLTEMHNGCPRKVAQDELRQYFETEFINKLREPSVSKSTEVQYIWGWPPESSPSNTSPEPARK